MNKRKYVIAKAEIGFDIYGMPFQSQDLSYVRGFVTHPQRAKGWTENGLDDPDMPRIHKTFTKDISGATKIGSLDDVEFLCAVFSLVSKDKDHKFLFRYAPE
mgnify:CR=1 FL=1